MRTVAPAKINWTLEVLGKRDDGYHEIRSVMQTIDLCDELQTELAVESIYETMDGEALASDDLIVRAARALEERVGRELPARIRVDKRIPVASGLGGGSSDAAAVLRLLNGLHGLGISQEEMASIGATVGSDVPFFVYGGTALVEGRGERVTPISDVPEVWLVLVVPPVQASRQDEADVPSDFRRDFSDGSRTGALTRRLSEGKAVLAEDLSNALERLAYVVFDGLECCRDALTSAGAQRVHLAGAGPALFTHTENEAAARETASRVEAPEGKVFMLQTLTGVEAIAVTN